MIDLYYRNLKKSSLFLFFMAECFICKASENKTILYDVISEKGIKKICKNCLKKEKGRYPLIKKKELNLKEQNVSEILTRISGINLNKREKVNEQDSSLRALIDKNFRENFKPAIENKNLIKNFHWIIMLLRRKRKLTQRQLADAILEPEESIKMIERGMLPKEWRKLITKIEKYFGVNLMKKENEDMKKNQEIKETIEKEKGIEEIDFSSLDLENITIGDLREIKKKKNNFFRRLFKNKKEEVINEEKIQNSDNEEIQDFTAR